MDVAAALVAVAAGFAVMIVVGALMGLLKPIVNLAADVISSGIAATISLGIAALVVWYLIQLGYLTI